MERGHDQVAMTDHMFRVIVCGGRNFQHLPTFLTAMSAVEAMVPEGEKLYIAEGGARGADAMARDWAIKNGVPCWTFHAAWKKHGKQAGPIRNAKMLRTFQPHMVVAFPGGTGTANMVKLAEDEGEAMIMRVTLTPSPSTVS